MTFEKIKGFFFPQAKKHNIRACDHSQQNAIKKGLSTLFREIKLIQKHHRRRNGCCYYITPAKVEASVRL